jgi:hypothetical protein
MHRVPRVGPEWRFRFVQSECWRRSAADHRDSDAARASFDRARTRCLEEFNTDLQESGAFRFAGGLHPPSSAKTVDATNDEPVVVDGPFVEAPEYVGGFWVIEAADQDAAVRWATKASKALGGRIEVRAFQEPPDA